MTPSSQEITLKNECPPDGFTSWRRDGFGMQYFFLMTLYLKTLIENSTLCPHVWHTMHHGQNPEDLFYFVGGDRYGPPPNERTEWRSNSTDIEGKWLKPKFYHLISQTCEFARKQYFSAPKPDLIFYRKNDFNIAIHIRRGDVTVAHNMKHPPKYFKHRYVKNAIYEDCISELKMVYKDIGEKLKFHIFSEGPKEEFQTILDAHSDAILHLYSDLKLTFHHMVMAHAIVVARSSFSKTAGFLSIGDVFYFKLADKKYGERWQDCFQYEKKHEEGTR